MQVWPKPLRASPSSRIKVTCFQVFQLTGGYLDPSLGLQGGYQPFGSPGREWDGRDLDAHITTQNIENDTLIIDLDFSNVANSSHLKDQAFNGNIGMLIGDYKLLFQGKNLTARTTPMYSRVNKKKEEKPY